MLQSSKKRPSLQSIVSLFVCFSALFILAYQTMDRSIWSDEAMLLLNYPLDSLSDIFNPLPLYAQSTSPLLSVLLSLFGNENSTLLRAGTFVLLAGGILVAFRLHKASLVQQAAAVLTILSMPIMLTYVTEVKHYGYEILGASIAIGWLIKKDPSEVIRFQDVVLLCLSLMTGFSTLIITFLALATYQFEHTKLTRKVSLKNLIFVILFTLATFLYYLVLKHAASLQLANFSDSYAIEGGVAILRFVFVVIVVASPVIPVVILTCILLNKRMHLPHVHRFVIYSIMVFVTFILLSFLGLYTVESPRHGAWVSAFVLAAILLSVELYPTIQRVLYRRIYAALLLIFILLPSGYTVKEIFTDEGMLERIDQKPIINFLANHEPVTIGLWFCGQPMIEYFIKSNPELAKHNYIGIRNNQSTVPNDFSNLPHDKIVKTLEDNINSPGSWVQSIAYYRQGKGMDVMAQAMVNEAPKNSDFYIYAGLMTYDGAEIFETYSQKSLLDTLESNNCSHKPALTVTKAFILQVNCKG